MARRKALIVPSAKSTTKPSPHPAGVQDAVNVGSAGLLGYHARERYTLLVTQNSRGTKEIISSLTEVLVVTFGQIY